MRSFLARSGSRITDFRPVGYLLRYRGTGGKAVFGLDESIAALGDGSSSLLVVVVAILLGLRHATDPDHLTAVSTLIAAERDRHQRAAGLLGLSWGLGHATTLALLGLPIVLFQRFLPDRVVQGTEVAIGLLIVTLGVRLLLRWRNGYFHAHEHIHGGSVHRHLHSHVAGESHAHRHSPNPLGRSPRQAFGIGVMHGVGGSAGVGILLVAAIEDQVTGVIALLTFALFTAVSMATASAAFGYAITRGAVRRRFAQLVPGLGTASMAFGVWYILGALGLVPYFF